MIVVSWTYRGLGSRYKMEAIKDLIKFKSYGTSTRGDKTPRIRHAERKKEKLAKNSSENNKLEMGVESPLNPL